MGTSSTLGPESLQVRPLISEDGLTLQRLFDRTPGLESVFTAVGAADSVSTFLALPEGYSYEAKYLLGAWDDGELVGAVDLIANYPEDGQWTCGLFLVSWEHRNRGIGDWLLKYVERLISSNAGTCARFLVNDKNFDGRDFLVRRGYTVEELPGRPSVALSRALQI